MLLYDKLKGTPVLFSTSTFHLVHMASLKFLSLNYKNTDNLMLEFFK